MSELSLTLLRLGFLVALWLFVFVILGAMRRDLGGDVRAPRAATTARTREAKPRRVRGMSRRTELRVTRSGGEREVLVLEQSDVTFGRGADNTVVLDDDYTSTHHARVTRGANGWTVEDLGSTNGTWIDRKRITSTSPLRDGMVIRIGRTEVAVHA